MTFAANVALLALAGLVTVFTLVYLFRSPWWRNRVGRIYAVKSVVLSAVLDQIVLSIWWDADYPGRQAIRFTIYTLGALVYLPMIWSLVLEQQRDRRKPEESENEVSAK
ncbi:hypothetical protein [Rhodococcus sp. (in: high G+C Gram-positive bacteria)]|uniref:putative phage holin n=1 Tax=Rhodococcus sp. TaxID=1831 RepID=UPI001A208F0C|nr:hypothetical protein [Rhodococcus sp. (in: high G+C Gram-positive bacteria)]MBJ7479264.1 hypothetical protein [Rhodococcus sp. (in: high G+C Gram-positive bacteria)]